MASDSDNVTRLLLEWGDGNQQAQEALSLDEVADIALEPDSNLLKLDEALNELAKIDPRQSRIVELRYFGGLTIEETAEVISVSPATVKREWMMARAWLHQEISESELAQTLASDSQ